MYGTLEECLKYGSSRRGSEAFDVPSQDAQGYHHSRRNDLDTQ